MAESLGKVVKSAGRALAILEFFDDIAVSATAVEVREALRLPASSASALLSSLVSLGYLHYDSCKRTYRPTSRVGLLGERVRSHWLSRGVRPMLESLTQQTGQLVVLGARCQLNAQYIQVIRAAGSRPVKRGTLAPLTRTAVGWMLMSELEDPSISRIAARINATDPNRKVSPAWLLAQIAKVRESGFAYCCFGQVTEGVGAISMPIPANGAEPAIVFAVGGTGQRFIDQKNDLIVAMRSHLACATDPRPPTSDYFAFTWMLNSSATFL